VERGAGWVIKMSLDEEEDWEESDEADDE